MMEPRTDSSIRIRLTEDEFREAWLAACDQALQVMERDGATATKRGNLSAADPDSYRARIEGALGERAVSAYLRVPYLGAIKWNAPDVVGGIEVRTRSFKNSSLFLYPSDRDSAPYVLVVGQRRDYEIVGWIYGKEGKDRRYWTRAYQYKTWPADPCFVIPRDKLRRPERLFGLLQRRNPERQERLW